MSTRRPPQNWLEMGFERGDALALGDTGEVVVVDGSRDLKYRGHTAALTPLTKLIRRDYPHLPSRLGRVLTFEGETIDVRFDRTYGPKKSR